MLLTPTSARFTPDQLLGLIQANNPSLRQPGMEIRYWSEDKGVKPKTLITTFKVTPFFMEEVRKIDNCIWLGMDMARVLFPR